MSTSILQNAIDSIALGVEDFRCDDPKRLMSAVRNFYAGMLLLFKHKLAALSKGSDEALIKQKVLPVADATGIVWKGQGKKTVDYIQIQERLESLGIKVDWKRLDAIQRYRNDIEHYHVDTKPQAVRQYISDCFLIVRDFITNHLGENPRQLLGEETWNCLIEEKQVYDAEKLACSAELDQMIWPNKTAHTWISAASCVECGSDLIRPVAPASTAAEDNRYQCSVCGQMWEYEALLTAAGSPHDSHRAHKEGGDPPVGICPECGNEGYDSIEQECAFCGTLGPHECDRCGINIPIEELSWDNGNLCGYCVHVLEKDD